MIPEDQKNMTTQLCSTGRLFTAATQLTFVTHFVKSKFEIHQWLFIKGKYF